MEHILCGPCSLVLVILRPDNHFVFAHVLALVCSTLFHGTVTDLACVSFAFFHRTKLFVLARGSFCPRSTREVSSGTVLASSHSLFSFVIFLFVAGQEDACRFSPPCCLKFSCRIVFLVPLFDIVVLDCVC